MVLPNIMIILYIKIHLNQYLFFYEKHNEKSNVNLILIENCLTCSSTGSSSSSCISSNISFSFTFLDEFVKWSCIADVSAVAAALPTPFDKAGSLPLVLHMLLLLKLEGDKRRCRLSTEALALTPVPYPFAAGLRCNSKSLKKLYFW